MKNRIVVLLMIGLIQNFVKAQDYIPSKDDLLRFPSTKTLVVLEDNPLSEYNLMLKETMPKEWKVTPYDFITWKEFEQKRLDPAFSFIVQTQVKIDKDKNNVKYNYMSLLLGGNSYSLNSMPDLCSIPLSYYGTNLYIFCDSQPMREK